MRLICTLTGAQVETSDDENARLLIRSGVFVEADEPKPKPKPRKKPAADKEA